MKQIENIFELPNSLPQIELSEMLVDSNQIAIKRIISTGQVTPAGEWYDQDKMNG
jgi:cupin 2 domain-containing protein